MENLSSDQIQRWYERGASKLADMTRVEVILNRLLDFDIYFREFVRLDLANMEAIKHHRDRIISLDSDEDDPTDHKEYA